MLKQIDKLLIKSFFPPFVMTFCVSSFVLILQFLWNSIDELSGKGVDTFFLLEMIGYLSVSLFPLALPLSILISCVMVMGGLSERYELSSFKSAGVPLTRVLLPLFVISCITASASFLIGNYAVPAANTKFKQRMKAVQNSKPAMLLEADVFNKDFDNIVIHIGEKSEKENKLKNIMIYDHSNNKGVDNKIFAKEGEMTTNGTTLSMVLKKGHQYQLLEENKPKSSKKYPYIITHYEEWNKKFDLSQFQMNEEDGNAEKKWNMLNTHQLRYSIDTLFDSYENSVDLLPKAYNDILKVKKTINFNGKIAGQKYQSTFSPAQYSALPNFQSAISEARKMARAAENQSVSALYYTKVLARHKQEYNMKYSMACVCMLFLFIGGPLGAIIRKGGFGWPMLVSIIFFMLFIVLNSFGGELAEEYVIEPAVGVWLPVFVLLPIGVFLTYKALNDEPIMDFNFITDLFKRFKTKKESN